MLVSVNETGRLKPDLRETGLSHIGAMASRPGPGRRGETRIPKISLEGSEGTPPKGKTPSCHEPPDAQTEGRQISLRSLPDGTFLSARVLNPPGAAFGGALQGASRSGSWQADHSASQEGTIKGHRRPQSW